MNWIRVLLIFLSLLSSDLVDINTADIEDLQTLPGIGPVKAQAIVSYRETYGPFLTVDELDFVEGIGPGTMESIAEFVVVEADRIEESDTLHWIGIVDSLAPVLSVSFLDVGQGDAILLQAHGGETWLFDGGPDDGGPLEPAVVCRLYQLGIDTIDVVAFSHPHADHIGGLASVLRNFTVKTVLDPGMTFPSFVYEDLLNAVVEQGCDYMLLEEGMEYKLSPLVSVHVISKGADGRDLSMNEASAVLMVSCGEFSTLLTGDIEEYSERMLTPLARPVTVLKVPHHGSLTSVFPPYLRRLMPQIAVFSAGRNNSFGHPHPRVLEIYAELGSEILRTDLQGTIVVQTDGSCISISSTVAKLQPGENQ